MPHEAILFRAITTNAINCGLGLDPRPVKLWHGDYKYSVCTPILPSLVPPGLQNNLASILLALL